MPVVQITMLQGRSAEQKRKIAQRITDALVEEAGARREGIVVAFHEVSKESYASGGELMIDKGKCLCCTLARARLLRLRSGQVRATLHVLGQGLE